MGAILIIIAIILGLIVCSIIGWLGKGVDVIWNIFTEGLSGCAGCGVNLIVYGIILFVFLILILGLITG